MEGLIPLVYRAIVQYKNGGNSHGFTGGAWFPESPSPSYMRLPGDSGRFQLVSTDLQFFHPTTSPSTSRGGITHGTAAQVIISSRVQPSSISRLTSRRAAV
ncbi:hypothetical protein SAY86_028921 [Trapa natans]|uniref:Uncharacterized protein n=1 Tax=Trapa natans TaxID=22666 RepID=A0AAN7RCN5_TRANT|nr:hypothetical protein SAY86_028921 [Trapa natans]